MDWPGVKADYWPSAVWSFPANGALLSGPRRWSGGFGERRGKIHLALARNRMPDRPAQSLVTKLTELSRIFALCKSRPQPAVCTACGVPQEHIPRSATDVKRPSHPTRPGWPFFQRVKNNSTHISSCHANSAILCVTRNTTRHCDINSNTSLLHWAQATRYFVTFLKRRAFRRLHLRQPLWRLCYGRPL